MTFSLTPEQLTHFQEEGYLLLKGFFDVEQRVTPIQQGIYSIIGLVAQRHGIPLARPACSPLTFDSGFTELIRVNREYGSEVYDVIKKIPAFVHLTADPRLSDVFRQCRPDSMPGISGSGSGIRIDIPGEDKFSSPWHQEYPFHLHSMDGIVFWSPLIPMTLAHGPVQICPKSHQLGLLPLVMEGEQYYSVYIENEAEIIQKHQKIQPLPELGDLLLMDYLTLHASGLNKTERPRWSIQFRYFNFNHAQQQQQGWFKSFAEGLSIRQAHPELIVSSPGREPS